MKNKFFAVILAMAAVLCLAACSDNKENDADSTYAPGQVLEVAQTTGNTHYYEVTPGVSDYDSDGNIILTSTDNRYVYVKETGYIVFSFVASSNACYQVLDVKSFADEEAAAKYLTENVAQLMATGDYTNVQQNGRYVVFTVSLTHSVYGDYLKGDRSHVESIFPDDLKQ